MAGLLAAVIQDWFQGSRHFRQVKAHRLEGCDLVMNLPGEGSKHKYCLGQQSPTF